MTATTSTRPRHEFSPNESKALPREQLDEMLEEACEAARVAETREVRLALLGLACYVRRIEPAASYIVLRHSDQGDWWDDMVTWLDDDAEPDEQDATWERFPDVSEYGRHLYDTREWLLNRYVPDVIPSDYEAQPFSKIIDLEEVLSDLLDDASSASRQHYIDTGAYLPDLESRP